MVDFGMLLGLVYVSFFGDHNISKIVFLLYAPSKTITFDVPKWSLDEVVFYFLNYSLRKTIGLLVQRPPK